VRTLRIVVIVPALALCPVGPAALYAATPAPTAVPSASAAPSPAASGNAGLAQFDTEAAAQSRCPNDKVVWLNLRNNVYFEKDSIYWGKTKRGAYVCRQEADAAGDRESVSMPGHRSEY
jgi:hypothetical protein